MVSLSVKQENTKALDLYLRQGYEMRGVVLILEAPVSKLECSSIPTGYELRYRNPAYLRSRKLRTATWWSSLTEPVDRLVYKREYKGVQALVAYRKRRIKGYVEFSVNEAVDVENVGLASYTDPVVLSALFCELARAATLRHVSEIRVYVDSSKSALVRMLEEMGFRVEHAEYLLVKELE